MYVRVIQARCAAVTTRKWGLIYMALERARVIREPLCRVVGGVIFVSAGKSGGEGLWAGERECSREGRDNGG